MQKIVLTGAAGKLGSQLRGPLAGMAAQLVSTDILDSAGDLAANESWVTADLADRAAMQGTLRTSLRFSWLVLLALAAPLSGAAQGVLRLAYPPDYLAAAPALRRGRVRFERFARITG